MHVYVLGAVVVTVALLVLGLGLYLLAHLGRREPLVERVDQP